MNRWRGISCLLLLLVAIWFIGCGPSPDLEEEESSEFPPTGSKRVSEIAAAVEALGYGPIRELEFEEAGWEVEAMKDGQVWNLVVDPVSGEVLESAAE